MAKEFDPAQSQKGAFISALGKAMLLRGLSAGNVLDGLSKMEMVNSMLADGLDLETAEAFLEEDHLDLVEAIDGGL